MVAASVWTAARWKRYGWVTAGSLPIGTAASAADSVRKPSSEQPDVPETMVKSYLRLARARGKLKPARLLRMWMRSRL
jgi:hypothetical protein